MKPARNGSDLGKAPAYTVSEAAHYLRLPQATLRNWIRGQAYQAGGGIRRSKPVIQLDDPEKIYLSFWNLVEAHVLAAVRRKHRVSLPNVRRALNYVREHYGVERPLVEQSFQTDGLSLFIDRYGALINVSQAGQQAIREFLEHHLERIERDARGLPLKLYPFTRTSDSPRLVVMSPFVAFGRPHLAGSGVPTAEVFERYQAGDDIDQLAADFGVDTRAIQEAIRCEAA